MRLHKLVIVSFDEPLPEDFSFNYRFEHGYLKYHDRIFEAKGNLYVFGAVRDKINYDIDDDKIEVRSQELEIISEIIRFGIDIISISYNNGRQINSSRPSVFLEAENQSDKFDLLNSTRIKSRKPKLATCRPIHKFKVQDSFKYLQDRRDGAEIYAEAISAKNNSDKLKEYFRVFEKAFKRHNAGLITPMSGFLSNDSPLGYTKAEISEWMKIRNKLIHSNNKDGYLVSHDLFLKISRIEQAVIDVLFNKKLWGNTNIDRRDAYKFYSGIKPNGTAYVKPKSTFDLAFAQYDENNIFPTANHGNLEVDKIPAQLWFGKPEVTSEFFQFTYENQFEVYDMYKYYEDAKK